MSLKTTTSISVEEMFELRQSRLRGFKSHSLIPISENTKISNIGKVALCAFLFFI